jgi:hypothetical protein
MGTKEAVGFCKLELTLTNLFQWLILLMGLQCLIISLHQHWNCVVNLDSWHVNHFFNNIHSGYCDLEREKMGQKLAYIHWLFQKKSQMGQMGSG